MQQISRHITRHTIALLTSAVVSSLSFAQTPPTPPRQPARSPQATPAPNRQAGQGMTRRAGPPEQERRRDGFGPGGGMAGVLLGMRQQLQLTDDQVKRLEALRTAPRRPSNNSDELRARADMMDAMKGDGDLTKARAAMDRMSGLRNDEAIARLKERQDVRNVLTATQKTTLDNMRGAMRSRVKQGMREGARQRLRQGREMRMRGNAQGRMQDGMRGGMRPGPGAPGFAPGGRRGMGGDNGPGMPAGPMGPPMGRRGRGIEQNIERDVVIERRAPVPPTDSLIPR